MDPITAYALPDSLRDFCLSAIPLIEWEPGLNKKTSPDIKRAMRLTQQVEMDERKLNAIASPQDAHDALTEVRQKLLGYRTACVKIEISRRCDDLEIDFSPEWAVENLEFFNTPSGRWYFYHGDHFLICTGPLRRAMDAEGDSSPSASISFQTWVQDLPEGVYQTLKGKPC